MPYSQPHYAVIVDGDVVHRSESYCFAEEVLMSVLKNGGFLEVTLQNTRAIRMMANAVIEQTKELIS